jgi:two-component system, cell cycle response regulator DivK
MNFDQWKVLVVEDEFDSLQTISIILRHYGIQVHVAHNGSECLDLLEQMMPTAIVMDLMMPEMDGWATLARIRANQRTAQLPVVAMTAYYSPEVADDARQAGFDGFFNKPLSASSFVRRLAEIVG